MKIFVTGGTGFVGRPTVELLRERGHELLILSRREGKGHLKGDLAYGNEWQAKVRDFKPDVTLHMAWEGIPKYDALVTAKNVANTLALYSFLVEIGCPKVVSTSSGVEYEGYTGEVSEDMPFPPADAPEIHGLLREGKIFLARFMERLSKETSSQFIRVALFFVYGPGQREASLLPSTLKRILAGQEPELRNPNLAHDFVYVGDVAEALVALVEKPVQVGRYNVASNTLTSVAEMANMALQECGKKPLFKIESQLTGLYANIAKIKKETGWAPRTTPQEGIRKMIESYRSTTVHPTIS